MKIIIILYKEEDSKIIFFLFWKIFAISFVREVCFVLSGERETTSFGSYPKLANDRTYVNQISNVL